MRKLGGAALVALATVVAATGPAKAQTEAPPPAWVEWALVDVDPARVEEFLAVQRELAARAKEAKVPWRIVARTEAFGAMDRFVVATPFDALARYDRKKEADPALEALRRREARSVLRRRVYAVRTLPDLANPLPEGERPSLILVNVVRVPPGREQEYLEVLRADFLPHFDEAKMHHETGTIAFGGESGFVHLFYVPSFAELDKGSPVLRALGAEGARAAVAKLGGLVTSSEVWIARLVPEASFGPEKPSTSAPPR